MHALMEYLTCWKMCDFSRRYGFLFVIVTPVMLDEDLNQKIQSLNNKQHLISFINGLENLLKKNQQKYLLKLIL